MHLFQGFLQLSHTQLLINSPFNTNTTINILHKNINMKQKFVGKCLNGPIFVALWSCIHEKLVKHIQWPGIAIFLTRIWGYGTFLRRKQTQNWDYIMILNLSDHTNGFSVPLYFILMDTWGPLCVYHLFTYQVVFHAVLFQIQGSGPLIWLIPT